MVHHQRGQGIIFINWHALTWEYFLEFRIDYLIRSILYELSFESCEFYFLGSKGITQANLVSVNKIISNSFNAVMLMLSDHHD